MNKQDLVKHVSTITDTPRDVCRRIIESALYAIMQADRTELRGFGVFHYVAVKQVGVRAGDLPVVKLRFKQSTKWRAT